MKKLLLLFIFASISFFLKAQIVSLQTAGILAGNFYSERILAAKGIQHFSMLEQPEIILENGSPALYVYKSDDGPGYIIVAADYSAYPVFGYSFESTWDEALNTPVFQDMISDFVSQITFARTNKISTPKETEKEWQYYTSNSFQKNNKDLKNLAPILQTNWNQGCYYNDLCPDASLGPCGKVWAGCVATAMGQVMKFHNWPPQGVGSNIYLTQNGYGTLNANFGETIYNWTEMQSSLNDMTDNFEVAQLLLHCGISVNMNYHWDGSGASTSKSATSMIDHFQYADYLMHQQKDYYSNEMWAEALYIELHSDRPVLYRGYGSGGGHAFVCDGYQGTTNKMFHFNLGWGGSANGYYSFNNVAGFAQDQAGIFGVEPKYTGPQFCESYKTLTAPSGVISDGSHENRYANNSNCKWLIQPEGAGAILLNFNYLKTEPGADRVLVFEGDSENGWLIADISGFNVPTDPIVVSGGSMFVWFFSDEFNAAAGWEAEYSIWATGCDEFQPIRALISPNPASTAIHIQLENPINENMNLTISDIQGKQVLSTSVKTKDGSCELQLPVLSNGLYFINLSNQTSLSTTEKLIIAN
jgi:hypothetical protein